MACIRATQEQLPSRDNVAFTKLYRLKVCSQQMKESLYLPSCSFLRSRIAGHVIIRMHPKNTLTATRASTSNT
ncbi:hypothetical protein VZ94_02245 [Methylocucumis oryzae]|uniref:Uncharacterized protein n=2 Tax=Methylocucumis oryzae TaxID=1632867 RepID=A0A0F3IM38_9GAMM|nr:hypothetical protein VZ94_02245 [Methylocucumis oryzae]